MIHPTPRRFHLVAASVGVATAIVATWPVAAHVRDHVVDGARLVSPANPETFWAANIGADVLTTVWIVAWVLHALVTQPLHLFEANIFYPAPLSLARCEHMFATALLGVPGLVLDGPVLAHQLALLLCFVLAGWSAAYVGARWTGSVFGGLVAGTLFAFQQGHNLTLLKLLGVAYFPLIVLGLERFGATGAVRWLLLGGAALVLEMLSGQYLAFFALLVWTIAGPIVVLAGRSAEPAVRRFLRDAALLGVVTAAAALVVLPFTIPYLRLSAQAEFTDNSTNVFLTVYGLQSLWVYVLPGPVPWVRLSPWVQVLVVAGVGTLAAGDRDDRVRLAVLVLVGVVGALLSMGPKPAGLGLYGSLATVVPGFRTLREPYRWTLVPHFAAAMLAGVGAAALGQRLRRVGPLLAAVVAAFAVATSWAGPTVLRPLPIGDAVPEAYRFLARCGEGDPLLELPATHPSMLDNFRDAERDYFSTVHWLPILNGRSGYQPELFRRTMSLAWNVPEQRALADLRAMTGLRWILVHCDVNEPLSPGVLALCGALPWTGGAVRVFGGMRLYDLGPVPVLPREWPRRWPARGICS